MGLTDGSASQNLALQKRMLEGYNPYASQPSNQPAPQPQPAASPAPSPVDPIQEYNNQIQKMIADWYSQKPATPAVFSYSPEQEASDTTSVQQQYRPFYQEQATQAGTDFQTALQAAREGFSRRGLWGAAAGTQDTTDASTGITSTNIGTNAPTGGPVSGLRQVGEQQMAAKQGEQNTSFNRAFTQSVAGGVQQRRTEAEDVYNKTVRQPYEDQYNAWLARLGGLQSQLK